MGIAKGKNEVNVVIENQKLEQVDSFKYLGYMTWNGSCIDVVRSRKIHENIAVKRIYISIGY